MYVDSERRDSGISLVGTLPWGTHFCQFYQTGQDLLDILVPYFKAGLKHNELCVWVVSGPLGTEEAKRSLELAVPRFGRHVERGQIEIVPLGRWLARGGKSGKAIVARLDGAMRGGFDGLRLACPASLGKPGDTSKPFGADVINRYNAIAVYTYPRDEFDAIRLMDVVKAHRLALLRNAGRWEVIESSEARIARDALRINDEKLRSLFSHMSEGFAHHRILLDGKGKPCDYVFLEVNDAFEKLTGLKREKVIGKAVTRVLPGIETGPTDWIGKYAEVALTGQPAYFEGYAQPLARWYSVSAFCPHRGFVAVTFTDITERKRDEEAREKASRTARLLSETSSLLLSSEAPERIVEEICRRVMDVLDCQVFFNYLADEGRRRLQLNACSGIPEETAGSIEWLDYGVAVCGSVARDGCPVIAERIGETLDPRTDLVRSLGVKAYACHPLRSGHDVIGTLSFGTCRRDTFSSDEIELMKTVTDQVAMAMQRKRSEEALRKSEGELAAILGSAPVLMVVIDSDRRVVKANTATGKFASRTVDEMTGLRGGEALRCLNSADDPEGCGFGPSCQSCKVRLSVIDTLVNGNSHHQVEWHLPFYRNGNIEEVPFLLSTVPLTHAAEKQALLCIEDISNIKQAEREITKLNEALSQHASELEAANKELEAFSYSVSHDLRAPLRHMDGFSRLVLEGYADKVDEQGREYLQYIRSSSELMSKLIDDLLDLSRIARTEVHLEKVDLSDLALEVAGELGGARPERHVDWVVASGLEAYGDRQLLKVVFDNLLGNAFKFTGKRDDARIEFGISEHDGEEAFFVRDNGVGFDMAYAGKLFQPFQRLHSAGEFPGTGVGLASVHRIISRLGGKVRAEGEPGKGATFYFTLRRT